MLVIRNPEDIPLVSDGEIRSLITERVRMLAEDEPYEPDTHGYFIAMEPGDSLERLRDEMGFSVLENRFTGKKLGDPDFSPCAEVIEEQATFFDAVYVIGDAGLGINLFVPKQPGVPAELLALCERYAIRAPQELQR